MYTPDDLYHSTDSFEILKLNGQWLRSDEHAMVIFLQARCSGKQLKCNGGEEDLEIPFHFFTSSMIAPLESFIRGTTELLKKQQEMTA